MRNDGDAGRSSSPTDPQSAHHGRPRRSGEGMESVIHHLQDHLRRLDAEQAGDEQPDSSGGQG
jgi:hypothetical protein